MDSKIEAKKNVLKMLRKAMLDNGGKGIGDSLSKMKVSVAADSKEGLEKGLDKAKEIMHKRGLVDADKKDLEGHDESTADEDKEELLEDPAEEALESPEEELAEEGSESEILPEHDESHAAPISKEEILAKIEELKKQLMMMK